MTTRTRRAAEPARSPDTILARGGLAGRPGRGGADPRRLPDRRPARRVAPGLRRPRRRPSAARSASTTARRSCGCSSAARPAAARRTWTASGPARTWPPSCELAALNREVAGALGRLVARARASSAGPLAHRLRRNTRRQSRRNIAAHYDLGNDFYRLFLDETMTYSSAVFASPDQSLADAQRNKYRLIAEGAGLARGPARPGDRHGLGRLRALRGRRARLPGDLDHDLAGAARPGPRARPRGRPGGPRRRPAARLPRDRAAPTTRSSRSRCSRRSAPSTSRRSSRPATRRWCRAAG